jgi:acylphosphatase
MPEPLKNPSSMDLSSPGPMKADVPDTVRKRFIVKGRVQRVGYRALILAFADTNDLKGFTRNLPDKTVEIVCEGEPEAIGTFLKAINRKGDPLDPLSINVVAIDDAPPPMEGELKEFFIDYGRKITPVERESLDRDEIMILGAGILNFKVDGVGKDVKEVGQKVDSMHLDMNTRFDHMAERYDMIATSLVKAIDRMDAGFERMDKSSKRTDKAIEQSRKEAAASNRELAKAVNFMIRKLSDRPARKRPAAKRKR